VALLVWIRKFEELWSKILLILFYVVLFAYKY
jgi:hypothetical protein